MATFELTEYSDLPTPHGNALPIPPLPWLRHSVVTTGPGNEFQLLPETRYIIIDRASADFRYKLGKDQAAVSGANAPTGASCRQHKTSDPPRDHSTPEAGSSGWWLGTV